MKLIIGAIVALLCSPIFARFSQTQPVSKVDLLVVMDNSGSMSQWYKKIDEIVPQAIEDLRGSDLRIGLTTTDETQNQFYIGSLLTGTFDQLVNNLIVDINNAGTNGSFDEAPLNQILRATTDPQAMEYIRRDGAELRVLVITDEDDNIYTRSAWDFYGEISNQNSTSPRVDLIGTISGCSRLEVNLLTDIVRISKGKTYDLCP